MLEERRAFWAASKDDIMRLKFYSDFIGNGSLAFDIGANLGSRTKIFSILGANVVALEPLPDLKRRLRRLTFGEHGVKVIGSAVGDVQGSGVLFRSEDHFLSSMSQRWIERVQGSGRFSNKVWRQAIKIKMTTLDELIRGHGHPDFVKIDVEGFEREVINGLTVALKALSLEYAAEAHDDIVCCLKRIDGLGRYRFNFSLGESMRLEFDEWLDMADIVEYLGAFKGDFVSFGDVYARHV